MAERVDFYLLSSADSEARDILACRLAEKGSQQGLKVYLRASDADHSERLDQLLWTFSAPSFVAHSRLSDTEATGDVAVLVGDGNAPDSHGDLLISLTDEVPADASRFDRVADVIPADDAGKQLGRARFKAWRDSGVAPTIHNL